LPQVSRARVSGIMEFGCFVELMGFRTKAEGLVHLTNISKQARGSAKDLVKRGQEVWVKVVSQAGGKLSLSMRDVDQATGQDLLPVNTERLEGGEVPNSIKGLSGALARRPAPLPGPAARLHALLLAQRCWCTGLRQPLRRLSAPTLARRGPPRLSPAAQPAAADLLPLPPLLPAGIQLKESDRTLEARRPKKKLSELEKWEAKQLIASGVLDIREYPEFDEDGGLGAWPAGTPAGRWLLPAAGCGKALAVM
jgi:ATP-dependent RNA helicase DHX8/PRP22